MRELKYDSQSLTFQLQTHFFIFISCCWCCRYWCCCYWCCCYWCCCCCCCWFHFRFKSRKPHSKVIGLSSMIYVKKIWLSLLMSTNVKKANFSERKTFSKCFVFDRLIVVVVVRCVDESKNLLLLLFLLLLLLLLLLLSAKRFKLDAFETSAGVPHPLSSRESLLFWRGPWNMFEHNCSTKVVRR